MPYHIAFDISHKPRGKIDDNLTELRDSLNSNDFMCYNFLEVPITEDSLKPYDILVFVCPDFTRISSHEITAIVNWVKNSGGGLLLLSHAGGDKGRGSNLSEISEQFGIAFENDQVLDERTNLGLENIPLISAFNILHPITSEIDELCYRSGCSLTIIGSGAFSIADSNETSEPFSCPLMCVTESGIGRVCCIGSYEMFRDKIGGGFQCNEHSKLALNIFQWLISDYRMELRTKADTPAPIPQIIKDSTQIKEQLAKSTNFLHKDDSSSYIGVTINISNNRELVALLKTFQNQINSTKIIIDKLVETAISAEDKENESLKTEIIQNAIVNQPENQIDTELQKTSAEIRDEVIIEINREKESGLTSLPPKPESLKKVLAKDNTDLTLKPAPKLKTKAKSKKELKDEKAGLETKLNSVEDLLNFIDKKHTSGKLNDDEYNKRSKKLQTNVKKTKKRINIIDKLLEK